MTVVARQGRGWNALCLLLVVMGCAAAYAGTLPWFVQRYQSPNGFYAHGPLIPLVSVYLFWRVWRSGERTPSKGSGAGVVLVFLALLAHLTGVVLRIDSLSGFSLLLLLPGIVWSWSGFSSVRRHWFALAFLIFAIPLPLYVVVELATTMKHWVMTASHGFWNLVGVDFRVQGSYLLLPENRGRLLVDDECCGLRSLIALIALGTFMAGTTRRLSGIWRWVLFGLAIPVALFANFTRVLFLCGVALWGSPSTARDAHDPSGWAVYVIAILLYVGLERWLPSNRNKPKEASS